MRKTSEHPSPLATRIDISPSLAGDVESFDDIDMLTQRIRAEHPPAELDSDGAGTLGLPDALEPPDALTADGTALHFPFKPELLSGDLELYRPYPGVLVFSVEFIANDPEAMHAISKTMNSVNRAVSVRIFHRGKISYRFGDKVFHSQDTPGVVSHVPVGGHFDYRLKKGEHIQLTHILITEEGEREIWHRLGIPPCPIFNTLRENEDPSRIAEALPNNEAFQVLGESFMHLPKSGFSRIALLRLKVGELLCLLGDVDAASHSPSAGDVPFSEVRKLSQARVILDESSEKPPSIAELSAMVGLNRRKLTEGFKKVFGETVAGYALELRMRKGYQLLRETQISVGEIAERCGYEHANNFSLAFRRRFHTSPTKVRRIK